MNGTGAGADHVLLACMELCSGKSRDDLTTAVQKALGTQPVYSYCESVNRCSLERRVPADITFPEDAFEGHVFNDDLDVRWARSGDTWSAWATSAPTKSEEQGQRLVAVRKIDRRYYLLGEWAGWQNETERIGSFSEGRYPGATFAYPLPKAAEPRGQDRAHPLPKAAEPRKQDRAYIAVIEYQRARPTEWPTQDAQLAALLDAPLLCGHRFVAVGVGRG